MSNPALESDRKKPRCEWCGTSLDTAATVDNPSAEIQADSLARCPSCLLLVVVGADLQPLPDLSADEAAFNGAMDANPEIREWAMRTIGTARIRGALEVKGKCAVTCEWLVAQGGPDLVDDLAALEAHAAGFDERGFTRASVDVRHRAARILGRLPRQTRRKAVAG